MFLESDECWKRTKRVLSGVPQSWKGTIYLSNGFIDAFAPFSPLSEMEVYWKRLKEFHQYLDDDRIVTLDMSWAQHMRLAAEENGIVYKSTHYHTFDTHKCDPSLGICGNVTEALANLMLGNTMAASGWNPSSSAAHHRHEECDKDSTFL